MPPSDSANLRSGNLLQHRRPHEVGRGLHDVHRLQRDHHVDRRVRRRDHDCDDEPMCRHTTVPSSLQARQNGSQWSDVEARVAELRRVLGERDRVAALLRDAPHLGGHQRRGPRSAGARAG